MITTLPITNKVRIALELSHWMVWWQRYYYVKTDYILFHVISLESIESVLRNIQIDPWAIRTEIKDSLRQGDAKLVGIGGRFPYTKQAKKSIDFAHEEAYGFGSRSIDEHHVFLGLLREKFGRAGKILRKHGIEYETIKAEIKRFLENPVSSEPPCKLNVGW